MQSAKQRYLDLLKRCLSNVIYQDPSMLLGEARPFDLASREASSGGYVIIDDYGDITA